MYKQTVRRASITLNAVHTQTWTTLSSSLAVCYLVYSMLTANIKLNINQHSRY